MRRSCRTADINQPGSLSKESRVAYFSSEGTRCDDAEADPQAPHDTDEYGDDLNISLRNFSERGEGSKS